MQNQCSSISMEKKLYKTVVVIPAYNEERFIEKTIKEIKRLYDIKVIVIDDGSNDSTYEKAKSFSDIVMKHKKTEAKESPFLTGL